MFTIEIAKLRIQIYNKFDFVQHICKDYIVESNNYDFSVMVTDEEFIAEKNVSSPSMTDGFIESVCIYRCIACELPKYNAFVLHSAAIEKNGQAFCFAAKSGVGKTTHISLWKKNFVDCSIINGDKPIVRFFDEKPYVCGTPWGGKENLHTNQIVPMRAICFLSRSETNHIERVSVHESLNLILNQLYIDKTTAELTIVLLNKLLLSIDLWKLQCNVSDFAATLSYETMSKGYLNDK